MIRTTLTTNPHRGVIDRGQRRRLHRGSHWSPALLTSFAAFFLGRAHVLRHISTTIGSPNVLRASSAGVVPDRVRRAGVRLGLLIRHSAGGIGAMVGLLFVVTNFVNFLPQSWQNHVDKWVPALAAASCG